MGDMGIGTNTDCVHKMMNTCRFQQTGELILCTKVDAPLYIGTSDPNTEPRPQ
jgi:hypothetical protein